MSLKRPENLIAKDGTRLKRTFWAFVKDGEKVYLYARENNKEVGIGPFRVADVKDRALIRADAFARGTFIHYPEELYVPVSAD